MTQRVLAMPILMALMWIALPAQAQPSSPTSPKGAEVKVKVSDPLRPTTMRGELLAVDSTQLWLLVDNRETAIPRPDVVHVDVRVHKFGGKRALLGGLVGGILTGLGMAVACSSIDDTSGCGTFVAAWEGVWLLVTAISAAFMEGNSWESLPLSNWSRIASYARYPQGPPPGMTAPPAAGN